MIRFKVYENGQPVENMSLNGSHLFGQDEIPVRSQLDFIKGELICLRHSDVAVGLVTLWDVAEFGKVLLQTTRLPEKNSAYNLNVEVVRGRLLRISQKREDWSVMDDAFTEEHHELLDTALEKFVAGLSHLDKAEDAAHLADEALTYAMRAGEEMALAHGKKMLEHRINGPGISPLSFGCCLDPSRIKDKKYLKYIRENFNFVTLPISWSQIEPKEQELNFELLDEWINWLSRNRIAVKVGPLLNFSPPSVPDWLYIWEHDFEQVREMAYDYITKVVQRYVNKVQVWEVASGLNVENCFKFSFEQIIEMTRSAVLAARHGVSRVPIMIEVSEPWGDYYSFNQRTIPPVMYIDMVCQSGINFDGLDIKLRFGRGGAGMQMRDLLELSSLLDRLGSFGKMIHLSGVQVPSAPDKRDVGNRLGETGFWHKQWNEQSQADWLEQAYQIALSKPFVETITWQDLVDRKEGILQNGGLLKHDFTSKIAYKKLRQLKSKLYHQRAAINDKNDPGVNSAKRKY